MKTGDPHSTSERLFASQHVRDLRLIAGFALLFFYAAVVFILGDAYHQAHQAHGKFSWSVARTIITFFGPTLALVIAVLSWAYQTGSTRLGVVDLFACEISTLCRVTLTVDTVNRRLDEFAQGPRPSGPDAGGPAFDGHPFTSQESYFPVFDANTSDLQALEATVVVNITAFYSYMKVARDFMRALVVTKPLDCDLASITGPATPGSWREAARNVLYMLFLGLESARHAVSQLVEFEPEKAERTVVILISELQAYRFLCDQYPDPKDIHNQRIRLRDVEYKRMVPPLLQTLKDHSQSTSESRARAAWEPAWRLLSKLEECYEAATQRVEPIAQDERHAPMMEAAA
jgi:hypothetical protein